MDGDTPAYVSDLVGSPATLGVSSSGMTEVALVASPSRPGRHFFPDAQVTVGGVPATNITVLENGTRLEFVTPRFSDVCGVDGASCVGNDAYQAIVVTQTGGVLAPHSIVEGYACPSACPGYKPPPGTPQLAPAHSSLLLQ